jgi:hypothetical protein
VVVGGMEIALIGCRRWAFFFSDNVIGGNELAVVRFNSLSTGVYHFST